MTPDRRTVLAGLPFWLFSPLGQVSPPRDLTPSGSLIAAARTQIGVTRYYDGSYQGLDYPGGDVPQSTGVCSDVVIRAYREAFQLDLQKEIHEDMAANFSAYPDRWGLTRPDRNIDHRRVPNIETWLRRQGAELDPAGWQKGDLVTMRVGSSQLPHIAIISDKTGWGGQPLGIHNIGRGTREEPVLGRFDKERRFRFMG